MTRLKRHCSVTWLSFPSSAGQRGRYRFDQPALQPLITWQEANGYRTKFATEASIDLAEDDELLQLMVDANIVEVFVGIESPDEDGLRETKKIQNLDDRHGTLLDKVHRIQQHGIEVWCGMIVDFDTDDTSVFERQARFLSAARIPLAMVNLLTAIPRTPLFARLEREGRLIRQMSVERSGLADEPAPLAKIAAVAV